MRAARVLTAGEKRLRKPLSLQNMREAKSLLTAANQLQTYPREFWNEGTHP
jgi:hypothetical protein